MLLKTYKSDGCWWVLNSRDVESYLTKHTHIHITCFETSTDINKVITISESLAAPKTEKVTLPQILYDINTLASLNYSTHTNKTEAQDACSNVL